MDDDSARKRNSTNIQKTHLMDCRHVLNASCIWSRTSTKYSSEPIAYRRRACAGEMWLSESKLPSLRSRHNASHLLSYVTYARGSALATLAGNLVCLPWDELTSCTRIEPHAIQIAAP